MADYPALPLWTDRYLADTRHLTREEHGAYLLLLMEAWRRPGCSLPDNDALLARLTVSTAEEWARLKPVIMAFWKLDGRTKEWTQKTLTRERVYVVEKSMSQRGNAAKRWNKTKKGDAVALPTGMPNACQIDAPTPTPTEGREEGIQPSVKDLSVSRSPQASTRAKTGGRLSPDWQLPKAWGDWALANCPGHTVESIRQQADIFRDHWIAKSGKDATKRDWEATWRNWMRRADPPGRRMNGNHHRTTAADLMRLEAQELENAARSAAGARGPSLALESDGDTPRRLRPPEGPRH